MLLAARPCYKFCDGLNFPGGKLNLLTKGHGHCHQFTASNNSPDVSFDSSTVSVILIKAPMAPSASPLCNLSSMALSNKLSRASGVRSAGSGGLEVMLKVAIAYESNLSIITAHSCRILFGLDPWLTIS